MKTEIHPIQARILRTMLFKEGARFADLNVLKLPTDHFNFHLKQLLSLRLVEKSPDNKYCLTAKGKEFANRLDTDKIVLEKQAKIGALICCVKQEGKIKKYLVQQRLKQPYYGFYGFFTGKIRWGETIEQTASRELKEETGLTGKISLAGIKHKMDYPTKGKILEDKFFFVFRVKNTEGKLLEKFEGGKNLWLTKKEIFELPDLFDGVGETINIINQKKLIFTENKYKVKGY
ncbi:MAG: NUDIX domain-containing protein [bacterium]|nr:NUDIX domain-containing protein [bacterium]